MRDGGWQATRVEADLKGTLYLNLGVPEQTRSRLSAMGHKVVLVENGVMPGGYQAIQRRGDSYVGKPRCARMVRSQPTSPAPRTP